ncbi:MAG: glycosyltransferase [Pseudomonadota bacterium]
MRVGITSYPMLFQRDGGLQVQLRETMSALRRLPCAAARPIQVELIEASRTDLAEYDLVHIFSVINGNHRIAEAAAEAGVPLIISPLVQPGWDRAWGRRARLADRVLGSLTRWQVQSTYAHMRTALELAHEVIALGEAERRAIIEAFQIDGRKVRIIPNGISSQFHGADGDLFRARTGIVTPFVLMVGAISPYKNQLGLAMALADLGLPLVLIGDACEADQGYLMQVRSMRALSWLGPLAHTDPLLASAYGAASVFALPSQGEVMPLAALEALAAGTPVVLTRASALCLPDSDFALKRVAWDDGAAQRRAVMALVSHPPARERVRALVRDLTWDAVAIQLGACYGELVHRQSRRAGPVCDAA